MIALILAAGMGKRMGKIAEGKPKSMVPLCGRPLLHRQIDILHKANIANILVLGGYQADQLDTLGYPVVNNDRYFETNMVSTLFCAEDYMHSGEDIIISYGDIVYELQVLNSLLNCKAPICIVVDKAWEEYWTLRMNNPLDDAETLKLTGYDQITELGKKAKNYSEIQGQYIGLIKVSGRYIKAFIEAWHKMDRNKLYDGKDFENMYMTSFLQHLIDSGWDTRAVFINNGWLEVDTESDLQLYEQLQNEGNLSKFYRLERDI